MASSPSVAVIGGGVAGLVCAARLGQLGIKNVTVFDTGIELWLFIWNDVTQTIAANYTVTADPDRDAYKPL